MVVEALLGSGSALDDYAEKLQRLDLGRQETQVDDARSRADRLALANEAIRANDSERVALLERLSADAYNVAPVELAVRQKPRAAPTDEPSPE